MADIKHDPYIVDQMPGHSLFFGGFHGLNEEGIPKAIQDNYEQTISRGVAFAYKGMWRAASSGIIRGAVVAAVIGAAVAAVIGMFNPATPLELGGAFNGMVSFLNPASSTTLLPVLAIGAAGGSIYEISQHRDVVQRDLAKTREAMRDLRSVVRDHQIGVEAAQEAKKNGYVQPEAQRGKETIIHDFDPMGEHRNPQGVREWVERSQRRRQERLDRLAQAGVVTDAHAMSFAEKEEARRQQQLEQLDGRDV